jgi:hypothetical protein
MEEKKMGIYKKAQVKRMILGLKPLCRKIDSLNKKIEDLMAEKEEVVKSMDSINKAIIAFAGNEFTDEVEALIFEMLKTPTPQAREVENKTEGEPQEQSKEEAPAEETENSKEEPEAGEKEQASEETVASKWIRID